MNLKRIYILLTFSILISFITFGQDSSISGFISDSQNKPISYANIVLLSVNDSIAIKGTTSNDDGFFLIKDVAPNTYILKTSFIGFMDVFNSVTMEDLDLEIGEIILDEDTEMLDEVSIIVKKPTLKKEPDRLIFSVANTALSEGNVMEVLRSTPSVLVLDNTLLVKNNVPTVYINDRKVHLSGSELNELLEGSPANTIKSIEVITNPPAKYDAEDGVVINIVMSNNLITGYRGNVFANYTQGVFPRYNVGTSNFYKTEKINVFASYSYTQNKINRSSNEVVNYLENDGSLSQKWMSNVNRNTWSKKHNLNVNFDYFVNDNNTLSLSANLLYLPDYKYLTNGHTDVFGSSNNFLYSFNNENLSFDNKHNLGFDFNFDHSFANDSKFSMNLHFTNYDYSRRQGVQSVYYNIDNDFDYFNSFNTESNQTTNIYTAQGDYSLQINDTSAFSAGLKSSFINTNNDISQYDVVNGIPSFNSNNSDDFTYNEAIFAAYVDYKKEWDKLSLSAGFRVEQTETNGKSNITNQSISQNYFEWFPTVTLSYQVSESVSVYSNYKRNIERPSYQLLNPFKYFLNNNTIVAGNPDLKPALTSYVELGASLNEMFYVQAYYKHIDANFLELPIQDNQNNLLIFTPTNLISTIEYGFDFLVYFNMAKWWNVYFVTSFYNIRDEAVVNEKVLIMDTWSNYTEFTNGFTFLKDKSLSSNFTLVFYQKNQQGFQIIDTRIVTDLSIKKLIFNKRGAITLSASDLFNQQDYSVTSKYLNQDNSRFLNEDNRYIKIGFSYKFGNTGLQTNERTKNRKERDRLEKE